MCVDTSNECYLLTYLTALIHSFIRPLSLLDYSLIRTKQQVIKHNCIKAKTQQIYITESENVLQIASCILVVFVNQNLVSQRYLLHQINYI